MIILQQTFPYQHEYFFMKRSIWIHLYVNIENTLLRVILVLTRSKYFNGKWSTFRIFAILLCAILKCESLLQFCRPLIWNTGKVFLNNNWWLNITNINCVKVEWQMFPLWIRYLCNLVVINDQFCEIMVIRQVTHFFDLVVREICRFEVFRWCKVEQMPQQVVRGIKFQ